MAIQYKISSNERDENSTVSSTDTEKICDIATPDYSQDNIGDISATFSRHEKRNDSTDEKCTKGGYSGVVNLATVLVLKKFCDLISAPPGKNTIQLTSFLLEKMTSYLKTANLSGSSFADELASSASFLKGFVRSMDYIPKHDLHSVHVYPIAGLNEYYQEVARNPDLPIEQRMKYDLVRCSSFSSYPNSEVSSMTLSKAGFYYEGIDDEVKCFNCGLKHKNWKKGDDPFEIHLRLSPDCSFIKNRAAEINRSSPVNSQLLASSQGTQSSPATQPLPPQQDQNEHISSATHNHGAQSTNGGSNSSSVQMPDLPRRQENRQSNQQNPCSSSVVTTCESSNVSSGHTQSHSYRNQSPPYRNQSQPYKNQSQPNRNQSQSTQNQSQSTQNQSQWTQNQSQSTQNQSQSTQNQSQSTQNQSQNTLHGVVSSPLSTPSPKKTAADTLEPLGISIEKPKYPQYAVLAVRLSSFRHWPKHKKQCPEALAKAGFVYEGSEDFTRCFFCGGGLRDWEDQDDPWVEHARWYPKCVFLRQCKGDQFVQDVKDGKHIASIENEKESANEFKQPVNKRPGIDEILNLPAAQSVLEMGYGKDIVLKAVELKVKDTALENVNAETLLQVVWDLEVDVKSDILNNQTGDDSSRVEGATGLSSLNQNHGENEDDIEALLEENRQLKDQQICKICMDEPVSIVFLPCGHMVTCANCAAAMRKCPLCRKFIKGTVKAILS